MAPIGGLPSYFESIRLNSIQLGEFVGQIIRMISYKLKTSRYK